jgi:3'-phosphoadenosine 5'-phosphosulfate sulfotransferase (PAPS reductase)/FAD synthetase
MPIEFTDMKDKTIVVWFSCGAASAVASKIVVDTYAKDNKIRVVNNPIAEEHPDNQRFLKDVEDWIGIPIETATNKKYPKASCVDVWNDRKYMSGVSGAPCTYELKKKARQEWEKENHHDFLVLGFTSDEKQRYERFKLNERDNILPVLIDAKVTKSDCYSILTKSGIDLPMIYKLGYPNANCIGCVKATSVTYWNHVRKVHPEVFKQRAEQSRKIGCKLTRSSGKRIFLDELSPEAKGRPLKNLDFECGIFCDIK